MNVWKVYQKLNKIYGPQGWWPIKMKNAKIKMQNVRIEHNLMYGIPYDELMNYYTSFRDPHFEIAIGAILTQNVAWKNVAQAIINLYQAKALTAQGILKLKSERLENLLVPTRYYKQKARAVRLFSEWLMGKYSGKILKLLTVSETSPCVPPLIWQGANDPSPYKGEGRGGGLAGLAHIRNELLAQWGIGKETADSIILYALNLPIFVIDVYTKRLCEKWGIILTEYDDYQIFFETKLSAHAHTHPHLSTSALYREYHALIVASGQDKHSLL